MSTNDQKPADKYEPPKGSTTKHSFKGRGGQSIAYEAHAGWIVLRAHERPTAEMFHVAYLKAGRASKQRPVTFVFNGGPGAASAYLHLGALGPTRVAFHDDGSTAPAPTQLVDNRESWLPFTDLVFIDPIGTGFSRVIPEPEPKNGDDPREAADKKTQQKTEEYYQLNRDLETLGEFVQRFLDRHDRWLSPVFIAGESYGGFRVAKLTRMLQERFGVGLSGAMLISPALEWYLLNRSDYDVLAWAAAFPSMAAASLHHKRSTAFKPGTPLDKVLNEAEKFAGEQLIPFLALGDGWGQARRTKTLNQMARFLGLDQRVLAVRNGRIDIRTFTRELLKDQMLICGLYDAAMTGPDPFPGRNNYEGPDPTLHGHTRVFGAGINAHLRHGLKLETDRQYHLLNMEVNRSWKVDAKRHAFDSQVGSTDDMRYGLALNPDMHLSISHGFYDLVTPYFQSKRIVNLMGLTEAQRKQVHLGNFKGGHMFYTWASSRKAFTQTMRRFYANALKSRS